jgi:hypothetical protein
MSKRTIDVASATTIRELVDVLESFLGFRTEWADPMYVSIGSDSVHLRLVEETLTDGSLVYNIEFTPVTGQVAPSWLERMDE